MTNNKFLDKMVIQLRHFREANHLSQFQMAERLKIGSRSYQRYESGESVPPVDFIFKVSKILNFKISELFNPEEIALNIAGLRIFNQDEKNLFESTPLVEASGIIKIAQSDTAAQVVKTGDLSLLKKYPEFMDSPYPLCVSTPKLVFLNKKFQEWSGHHISQLSAFQTGQEDMRIRGILWATLIEHGNSYVHFKTVAQLPVGRAEIDSWGVFRAEDRNYFGFGVFDLKLVE